MEQARQGQFRWVEVGLGLAGNAEERTLDFVLVFRALRLIRLAGSIER